MYNFYYRHQDFAVLAIPGCGSESLADGGHLTPRDVALNYPRVLAFVREPIGPGGRLRSKFQFFFPFPGDPRHAPTYEQLIDRILDQPKGTDYLNQPRLGGRCVGEPTFLPRDPHWIPQATLIDEAPVAPTEIWRFDVINDVIPGLRHFHQSDPIVVDATYRIQEVRSFYSADTQLWLNARVV